jgi:hypothetical protein
MLFWEFSRSPGTATVDVEYFARVQARVRQTGNELLVVTVPEKHQVYGRLLKHPDGSSVIPVSTHSFQDLARDVEAAKIPVVDLTSVLSEQANRLFLNGQYNYHDDDTHWNPVGIRLGSEAIAAKWRSMSEARGGQR